MNERQSLVVSDLITLKDAGLYCELGDFYIDPWSPVTRAVITHAHSDHTHPGNGSYLTAAPGEKLLRARLDENAVIETIKYGEKIKIGGVQVSLHSAGHVLGSSQVRVESSSGEVWVVSGDYKTAKDPTCTEFDLVKCDTFITESTFGLPIFRWTDPELVYEDINSWWESNKTKGKASILYGYALGKIQRLLAGIDPSIGPIYTHGAVEKLVQVYRASGVELPETVYAGSMPRGTKYDGAMILAPPSAQGTPWTRTFGTLSTAFASGWMRIRGTRRRKSVDRGFILSDHADWNALQSVIAATGAERIIVTHGYAAEMVRWLNEKGLNASSFKTNFEGESQELQAPDTEASESEGSVKVLADANGAEGSGKAFADAEESYGSSSAVIDTDNSERSGNTLDNSKASNKKSADATERDATGRDATRRDATGRNAAGRDATGRYANDSNAKFPIRNGTPPATPLGEEYPT